MVSGRVAFVLTLVLCLAVVPISGLAIYTFGGTFNHKVIPLQNSATWALNAQSLARQAPAYTQPHVLALFVGVQLHKSWEAFNQSEQASGVGNASPCWFNAVVQQTYGYGQFQYVSSFAYLANITSTPSGAFTNNSVWQVGFATIGANLDLLLDSLTMDRGHPNLENCIYQGNEQWFGWFFGDIALFVGGFLFAATRPT